MRVVMVSATTWIRETIRELTRHRRFGRRWTFSWVVVFLGLGFYLTGYVGTERQPLGVRTANATTLDSTVVVTATNFEFHPATVTIPAGTTVTWVDSLGNHTIEMDDKSFTSKPLIQGMRDTHRFDKPGKFLYHCQLHGDFGLVGMSGTIVVTPN